MKYYSEVLEKLFDSIDELTSEEAEFAKEEKEKELMYDRVVDALKRSEEAKKEYTDLKAEYIDKYGSFSYKFEKGADANTFPFNFFLI